MYIKMMYNIITLRMYPKIKQQISTMQKPQLDTNSRNQIPEPLLPSLLSFSKCLLDSNTPQFSPVAQLCPAVCNSMNCNTPGLLVHHQLPEFTQTHVYRVSDAIQPSHPLSSLFPPAPNPSQHQSLFQ